MYQELQLQHISVYPALTDALEAEVLKEHADPNPSVVWERTNQELSRISKMELFNPLGYDNPPTAAILATSAATLKAPTLSEAATVSAKWKIGVSYAFQQRPDLVGAIDSYNLPSLQGPQAMEPNDLFPGLTHGDVTMIATDAIDGRLTQPAYRILADDRHAFPPSQACLLTRDDVLAAEPRLRAALAELSGKFSTEMMRKMSAEVDLDHREPAAVAAEFLTQAGLK